MDYVISLSAYKQCGDVSRIWNPDVAKVHSDGHEKKVIVSMLVV